MKKSVIYLRNSSENQNCDESLKIQKNQCLSYAKANKIEIAKIFQEAAKSGIKTDDREQLKCLLDFCSKNKNVDWVIVYKIDRFTRNSNDLRLIKKFFDSKKTSLVCVYE